jgi:hypothetical protein
MDEPPIRDIPQLLQLLAQLEDIAMQFALDTSRGPHEQLGAVQVAHKLLLDRLRVLEMSAIETAQRHLEAAIGRDGMISGYGDAYGSTHTNGGSRSRRTKNNDLDFHGHGCGGKRRSSSPYTADENPRFSPCLLLNLMRHLGFVPHPL